MRSESLESQARVFPKRPVSPKESVRKYCGTCGVSVGHTMKIRRLWLFFFFGVVGAGVSLPVCEEGEVYFWGCGGCVGFLLLCFGGGKLVVARGMHTSHAGPSKPPSRALRLVEREHCRNSIQDHMQFLLSLPEGLVKELFHEARSITLSVHPFFMETWAKKLW